MNYREINFDILKDIDKKKKYIIIPIGTIEVHGPHLPFGTDLYIAEAFSNEFWIRHVRIVHTGVGDG